MRHHAGSLGPVFNDPEHLTGRNVLHGVSAVEIPGTRVQHPPQFAVAFTGWAVTHFAGHRLGAFLKDFLARFPIRGGRNRGLGQRSWSRFGFRDWGQGPLLEAPPASRVWVWYLRVMPSPPARAPAARPRPASEIIDIKTTRFIFHGRFLLWFWNNMEVSFL